MNSKRMSMDAFYTYIVDENNLYGLIDDQLRNDEVYNLPDNINFMTELYKQNKKRIDKFVVHMETNVFKSNPDILYHSTNLKNASLILKDAELKVKDRRMNSVDIAQSEYFTSNDLGQLFLSVHPTYFLTPLIMTSGNNYLGNVVTFCIDTSKLKEKLYKVADYITQEGKWSRLETSGDVPFKTIMKYIEDILHGCPVMDFDYEYYIKSNINLFSCVKRIYYFKECDTHCVIEVNDNPSNWTYYQFDKMGDSLWKEA
ncbi:hypothetical protein [Aneurinibacillus tyrosinisolvens]|uniref:hypothetical protein n=1 Tax=Aneurinibacillus tyrosinisolvens TaxID=1443435 RepID=UPI00063F4122|nr:hypothetical protein [Aneurinibacillus tyrosinisolvens]